MENVEKDSDTNEGNIASSNERSESSIGTTASSTTSSKVLGKRRFDPVWEYFRTRTINGNILNKCIKYRKKYSISSEKSTLVYHVKQHGFLLESAKQQQMYHIIG